MREVFIIVAGNSRFEKRSERYGMATGQIVSKVDAEVLEGRMVRTIVNRRASGRDVGSGACDAGLRFDFRSATVPHQQTLRFPNQIVRSEETIAMTGTPVTPTNAFARARAGTAWGCAS